LNEFLNNETFDEELYTLALEALEILVTSAHNNPWLQTQEQYQNGIFQLIFDTIPTQLKLPGRTRMIEKLVNLISALCSNQPSSLLRFMQLDGIRSLLVPIVEYLNTKNTEDSNKIISKIMFLLFNLSVAEESLPSKTRLASDIMASFDVLIKDVLNAHAEMKNESEIDLVEKTLLVLRDLSMADHVKNQYQQNKSKIQSTLQAIEKEAKSREDQGRFYDINSYIEEINY
jgi:hypothetical protein